MVHEWHYGGVRLVKQQIWGDLGVLQGQASLDEARKACRSFGVPDNGLDGSD